MTVQKGDTCRVENDAEKEILFLCAGLHKGRLFCLENAGGDSEIGFKMCWVQSWSVQTSPSGFHAVIENTACAGKLILTYILQMPLHVTVIVLLKSRIPSAAEQLEFTAVVPFKKKPFC